MGAYTFGCIPGLEHYMCCQMHHSATYYLQKRCIALLLVSLCCMSCHDVCCAELYCGVMSLRPVVS